MGLRLVGAIVVFSLIATGLYWIINNVELKKRDDRKEHGNEP